MPHKATAWFLYPGSGRDMGKLASLVRQEHELRDIRPDEVLAEPLYGCWEGNMNHALLRQPIDICKQRGEERVILGNAGVVRILQTGAAVKTLEDGQYAIVFGTAERDPWGYTERVTGYDAPGTMGCLSTRAIFRAHELMPIPDGSRHSLPQWAAFSARYITAWSNWELAYGCYRLQVGADELAAPHVWGWGGGTTLAELDLARRHGCRTVMVSGDERRLGLIEASGVTPLDRRQFPALVYDEHRVGKDSDKRRAYQDSEQRFLDEVKRRTDGLMVQIFVDYIGTPLLRATLKALGRQGVITTAGWQQGMVTTLLRAVECIGRHQHIHTHYARYPQGLAAVAYGEREGWMPVVDDRIYSFDEIPALAEHFHQGQVGFFPVYLINP